MPKPKLSKWSPTPDEIEKLRYLRAPRKSRPTPKDMPDIMYYRIVHAVYVQGRSKAELARELDKTPTRIYQICVRGKKYLYRMLYQPGLYPRKVDLGDWWLRGGI